MIISALIAIEAKDLFASIIAFGMLGLELSLALLILRAPDIAAILLTIEMITLAVFAGAVQKHKLKPFIEKDVFSSLTFIAFSILFIIICMRAFIELPVFGNPLMRLSELYTHRALNDTGSTNLVSAIIYGFRGLDSLIVVILLFLTSMGVLHITEKKQ